MKEKEYPFYVSEWGKPCLQDTEKLPVIERDRLHEASAYIADPELADAVNVALLLGQPLLLTGEPGTGKTQLAYSLACQLGYKDVLKFDTKSTSVARDLFYTYDALHRFHAVQRGQQTLDNRDYITYKALGTAILRSREPGEVKDWLPRGFEHSGKRRSIVLIDEIDKAPRDFPNDLLNEMEEMSFSVPELGGEFGNRKVAADDELRPIVVITSNSEKTLPDAFLRRCIFYNIPFPEDAERLKEIALAHLGGFVGEGQSWLDDALHLFTRLRDPARGLEKPPATAELLNWLNFLRERLKGSDGDLRRQPRLLTSSFGALTKTAADRNSAAKLLKEWDRG